MLYHSQPVYIGVPGPIGIEMIDEPQNVEPLNLELAPPDASEEQTVVNTLSHKLSSSQKPIAIIDAGRQLPRPFPVNANRVQV